MDDTVRAPDMTYNDQLISSMDSEMDNLIDLLRQDMITQDEFDEMFENIEFKRETQQIDKIYETNLLENDLYQEKLLELAQKSVEKQKEFYAKYAHDFLTYLHRMKNIDKLSSEIIDIVQNIIIYDNVKIETKEKREEIIEIVDYILHKTAVSRKLSDETKEKILNDFRYHITE
jgi:hypothetical protein